MRIVLPDIDDSVVVDGVSWSRFEEWLAERGDISGKRIAYDEGRLEIMSPSRLHERVNRLFCLFLSRITRAFGLEVVALGSTTLRRPEVFKAVEPDSCFFIGSPSAVRMALRRGDDLSPNLAIEVDVTRKSLDRLPIYATLDVPEVWRYSGGTIEVYLLRNDEYEKSPASRLFPRLPVAELARFLDLRDRMGDNEIGDAFRAWLGEQSAGSD